MAWDDEGLKLNFDGGRRTRCSPLDRSSWNADWGGEVGWDDEGWG